MRLQTTLRVLCLLALVPFFAEANTDGIWRIKKDRWSDADEAAFSDFVQKIGESKCRTTAQCLNDPANPYRDRNPSAFKSAYSDCSRLPYVLRLYFAYMNDLPFSYQSKVAVRDRANEKNKDIRYSSTGNTVVARQTVRDGTSAKQALRDMMNVTSSALFRIAPEEDIKSENVFPDFYSPAIDRRSIRPGTVVYDPNGHVLVVYKVESDGRVRFIDAHPDNSITRGVYGEKFSRSRHMSGAGFKNWRPIVYSTTGRVIGRPNAQIPDYSTVQFYGTHPAPNHQAPNNWKKGKFVRDGQTYDYYDYVRVALAEGNLRFKPVQELENILEALCYDAIERVTSVDEAIQNGIHRKAQPERLPYNIYGTNGEWEIYSTPSRDARLKTSFREAHKKVEQFIRLTSEGSPMVEYSGSVDQLKVDLAGVLRNSYDSCKFTYKNSNGIGVELSLEDVEERIWDLSFDPYHCPEARWGARGSEMASCGDGSTKRAWYAAEQRLRNQMERTYDSRMDFNLSELQRAVPGSGVDEPPAVNLKGLLGL